MKRFAMLLLFTVAALTLAACGGGGDRAPAGGQAPQKDGGASRALVMEPGRVLGASAEAFADDVQSVSGDLSFDMQFAGFSASGEGDFAFAMPDRMHMTMKMGGGGDVPLDLGDFGAFELLARDNKVYMNSGFTGWLVMSPEDLGADAGGFQDLLSGHSPLDYEALTEKIGGDIEHLGTGEIDGEPFERYRATVQLDDVLNALSESFGSTGGPDTEALAGVFSGPIVMDVWVHGDSFLPRRLQAAATFGESGEDAQFTMTLNFTDYNGAVEIPDAPADAHSFMEIFSGLAGDGGNGTVEFDFGNDSAGFDLDGDGQFDDALPDFTAGDQPAGEQALADSGH
ncbi:MAG: hypothetical protein Q7T33_00905 [Dehalococcoidia bacterium]|nr:hypothetical protein [Dehalococcoidia bacterium]